MPPSRTPLPSRGPRLTIGRLMLGIAALGLVIGLAIYETWVFVVLLFVGINVLTFYLTRPPDPHKPPRNWSFRKLRFSIWQIMAVVAVVAVLAGLFRHLVSVLYPDDPLQGPGRLFWMAVSSLIGFFAVLAVFGVAIYATWSLLRLVLYGLKGDRKGTVMPREAREARPAQEQAPELVEKLQIDDPRDPEADFDQRKTP